MRCYISDVRQLRASRRTRVLIDQHVVFRVVVADQGQTQYGIGWYCPGRLATRLPDNF
jgi:hypothetical protein